MARPLFAVGAVLACAILSTTAAQAEPTPADKAAAEALFDEGRALLRDGKIETACGKLAESQRLDPAVGTLMHLAGCYERAGKLASAWALFREAAMMARAAGQTEREKVATARSVALDARVPHLTIVISTSSAAAPGDPDPEITRDGVPVAKASWGSATPVDPGPHLIEARGTGRITRSISLTVGEGDRRTVEIPALEREPVTPRATAPAQVVAARPVETRPPPSSVAPPADPSTGRSQRVVAVSVAGAGVIAVGVGAFFGARAMSLASDVDQACPSGACSTDVKSTADDSRSAGTASTILFLGGGAALAAGAALWFFAPRPRETAARLRVAPSLGGMTLAGSFQ